MTGLAVTLALNGVPFGSKNKVTSFLFSFAFRRFSKGV